MAVYTRFIYFCKYRNGPSDIWKFALQFGNQDVHASLYTSQNGTEIAHSSFTMILVVQLEQLVLCICVCVCVCPNNNL